MFHVKHASRAELKYRPPHIVVVAWPCCSAHDPMRQWPLPEARHLSALQSSATRVWCQRAASAQRAYNRARDGPWCCRRDVGGRRVPGRPAIRVVQRTSRASSAVILAIGCPMAVPQGTRDASVTLWRTVDNLPCQALGWSGSGVVCNPEEPRNHTGFLGGGVHFRCRLNPALAKHCSPQACGEPDVPGECSTRA